MLDKLSAPRRAMDFEDYIDIIRRNFRWIIGPAFIGLVIATVVAFLMEDTFVSNALLKITPQQVPEAFVQSVINQQLADRINSMASNIQSRAQLTALIQRHGLYKKELAKEPIEDVLTSMRKAIKIIPTGGLVSVNGRNFPTFQVSFAYRERMLAQKVCQDLVSQLVDENLRQVNEDLGGTNDFLMEEYKQARTDLEQLESKLAKFRTENAGHLPEEMQLNLQQMNGLEGHLGSIAAARNRLAQERMVLNSQMEIQHGRLSRLKDLSSPAEAQNERVRAIDRQIVEAQNNIASLRERYTETYPDIQSAKAQVELLRRRREEARKEDSEAAKEAQAHPLPMVETPEVRRERQELEITVQQLKTQMKAKDLEEAAYVKDERNTNAALASLQNRLSGVPAGEKQYGELMRDRDLARQRYQEQQVKLERSQMAGRLQTLKKGESLELLDSASLPDAPSAPKRPIFLAMGAGLGFAIGLAIVAMREVKDTTLKSLKDARLGTHLTILGSVPLLENDSIVQRRKQILWVGWATATLVGIAVMVGSVARYYMHKV